MQPPDASFVIKQNERLLHMVNGALLINNYRKT